MGGLFEVLDVADEWQLVVDPPGDEILIQKSVFILNDPFKSYAKFGE